MDQDVDASSEDSRLEAMEREDALRAQEVKARARAKYDSGEPLFSKAMIAQALKQRLLDPMPEEIELLDVDGAMKTVPKPWLARDYKHYFLGIAYTCIHNLMGRTPYIMSPDAPLCSVDLSYHYYGSGKQPHQTAQTKEFVGPVFARALREWRASKSWREVEAHIRRMPSLPRVDKIIAFGLGPVFDYDIDSDDDAGSGWSVQSDEDQPGNDDVQDKTAGKQKEKQDEEPSAGEATSGSRAKSTPSGKVGHGVSASQPSTSIQASQKEPADSVEEKKPFDVNSDDFFNIDRSRRRSYAQHCLLITLSELLSELQGGAHVSIHAQEPCYFPECLDILRDYDVDAVAGHGEKFLLVDEASFVVTCSPDIPVRQIVTDIARPAAMVWQTVDDEEDDFTKQWKFTGKYRLSPYTTDNDSNRVRDLVRRYHAWRVMVGDDLFGEMSLYVRRDDAEETAGRPAQ